MTISGTSRFDGERQHRSPRFHTAPSERGGVAIVSYPDDTPREERFLDDSRFPMTEMRLMVHDNCLPVGAILQSCTGIRFKVIQHGNFREMSRI